MPGWHCWSMGAGKHEREPCRVAFRESNRESRVLGASCSSQTGRMRFPADCATMWPGYLTIFLVAQLEHRACPHFSHEFVLIAIGVFPHRHFLSSRSASERAGAMGFKGTHTTPDEDGRLSPLGGWTTMGLLSANQQSLTNAESWGCSLDSMRP